MKFKIGDKVRIVGNECGHQFKIGEIVTIQDVQRSDYKATNGHDFWFVIDDELEPAETRKLEVGKTYESANYGSYKCIAVNETHAWLTAYTNATAYVWTIDGKSSLGPEWDIVFAPIIEVISEDVELYGKTVTLDYTVKDGEPDWDTLRVFRP